MMQTRTIFLGKSDLVKISWPLQQCATWLASHPPPASSNALPVRAWDCLGLLSCGAAGDVAKAKDFFNPPLFIVLVPPLHCLGDHAIQVSGGNGSGSGSSGGSGPSPSGSSSKRRHSKFVAGNAQVRF
jgi:hypothetical protein